MKVRVLTIKLKWVDYQVSPLEIKENWVIRQILNSKFGFWGWLWFKRTKQ